MKLNFTTPALAILAAVTIAATGCAKQNEKDIQQHYYVNFTNGAVSASANFTTSENTPRPVVFEQDRVRANGLTSNANTVLSAGNYSWDLDTVNDVTFTLQLKKGMLTNTVGRSSMANSEIVVDSAMSINDTIRMSWTGNPVQAGEAVNVFIGRNFDSVSSVYYSAGGQIVGEGFVFEPSQTSGFKPGTYTITMTRQKVLPLQQTDNGAGGEMHIGIYTTKTVVLY